MTPRQLYHEHSYGSLLAWIAARNRHESDVVTEQYRIARIHAYRIINSFVGKLPTPKSWWPLPGDTEIKPATTTDPPDEDVLVGGDFVRAFGAAFGLN